MALGGLATEIWVAMITSFATVMVASIGFWAQVQTSRNHKEQSRTQKQVEEYSRWITLLQAEVRARVDLETEACRILSENTGKSANQIKIEVRDCAEQRTGRRPQYSASARRISKDPRELNFMSLAGELDDND